MDKKLIIFGNAAVAKVAYYAFKYDNGLDVSGFTVDEKLIKDDEFLGLPLVSFEMWKKAFLRQNIRCLLLSDFTKPTV